MIPLRAANAERVATRVLKAARLDSLKVEVVFVDDEDMRDLNQRFRGVDAATDVLSFAAQEGEPMPGTEDELGSLVISLTTAMAQANDQGHSVEDEVAVLTAHGLMHLLGMDHERSDAEARAMAEQEMSLLDAAGCAVELALMGRALAP